MYACVVDLPPSTHAHRQTGREIFPSNYHWLTRTEKPLKPVMSSYREPNAMHDHLYVGVHPQMNELTNKIVTFSE